MKHIKSIILTILAVLCALPGSARDFEYEGLIYTVIDEEAHTCKTKEGISGDSVEEGNIIEPGNNVEGNVVIPSIALDGTVQYTVMEIGNYSFLDCTELTSITIPESVTSIGYCAFYECTSLTSIDIPDSLTSIGNRAFCRCTSLTSIDLPDSLTLIENATFYECNSLTSIDIPNSVTVIMYSAFSGCSSLISIDLPDSLTNIGDWAFSRCTSLTSINLPDSLTKINWAAFYECTSLTSIELPEGLTSIESRAFDKCTHLREVTYLATNPITSVADVFSVDCYQSATLNAPNATLADIQATVPWSLFGHINARDGSAGPAETVTDFEYEGIWYSVIDSEAKTCKTKDGSNSYEGDLVIPEVASDGETEFSVVEIGGESFRGSSELLSVTLPSTINSIGRNAFADCERLSSLVWTRHERLNRNVTDEIGNPNLLLYVDSFQFAPQGMERNVVADGVCRILDLTPGHAFTPVNTFTALRSRMIKEFRQETPIGGSAGWETIVLPFDVDDVYAENIDSHLIPFALVTDVYAQRPYWLYEADQRGEWKHAFVIQAGIPYVISTPNNPEYPEYYNVEGPVVFSSDNPQRISPATTAPYAVTWASGREFRTLWRPLDAAEAADAMGLNAGISDLRGDDGQLLAPGSAFVAAVTPKPLEAYVTRTDASRAFPIRGTQSAVLTLLADNDGLSITQEGDAVILMSDMDRTVDIFSADGTLLRRVTLKAGESAYVDALPQGVCIVAGRKILIR